MHYPPSWFFSSSSEINDRFNWGLNTLAANGKVNHAQTWKIFLQKGSISTLCCLLYATDKHGRTRRNRDTTRVLPLIPITRQ